MIHYTDNPSCSALRNDKAPHFTATSPGMFRNWQRALPSDYCAECASDARTDSDRYAELRALVEELQRSAASPFAGTDEQIKRLLDWSHR